jgi:HK97 family phage prohead protease
MIRILTKSGDEYEPKFVTGDELTDWFKSNTDDEGNVTDDIVVYTDAKAASDGVWILSDFTLDRDNERIDPDGWDTKRFKQNPIMLWGHDSSRPAIGKVDGIRKQDGALVGKPDFDMDDEFAANIARKVDKGILTKGSVGFRSLKVEIVEADDKEKADLIHRKQELYEFSIVNIPSNPNAGVRSMETEMRDGTLTVVQPRDPMTEIVNASWERAAKKIDEHVTYLDTLFDDRETSGQQVPETRVPESDRETSDLDYMFEESDEKSTLKEFFNG